MQHGKTDKTGGTVGRPSCQSSLLSDPSAKFSVEMWRMPPRTRKVKKPRNAGTVELTCKTQTNKEIANKEGRHVGLDFYDLLIEGHNTQNPLRTIRELPQPHSHLGVAACLERAEFAYASVQKSVHLRSQELVAVTLRGILFVGRRRAVEIFACGLRSL